MNKSLAWIVLVVAVYLGFTALKFGLLFYQLKRHKSRREEPTPGEAPGESNDS